MKTFLFTMMAEEIYSESVMVEDFTSESVTEEDEVGNEDEPETETTNLPLGHYVIVIVGESVQEGDTVISPTIRFEEITEDETSSALPEIIVEERDVEDSDIDETEGLMDAETMDMSSTWTADYLKSLENLETNWETPENLEED